MNVMSMEEMKISFLEFKDGLKQIVLQTWANRGSSEGLSEFPLERESFESTRIRCCSLSAVSSFARVDKVVLCRSCSAWYCPVSVLFLFCSCVAHSFPSRFTGKREHIPFQ